MLLINQIEEIAASSLEQGSVAHKFLLRAAEGKLTRDENPTTHFSVYFLPYNPKTKEIFIVAHKKSGLWLSPGGHIDKGELLLETLEREM